MSSPHHITPGAFADYRDHIAAIDEATIAWFGGWLSADGSIKASEGRPCIRFVLTDRDPLDRFAELFGNTVGGPYEPSGLGRRPRFEWKVTGSRAHVLLQRVMPWLSERYRERADAFDGWAPRGHAGKKLTPDDVADIKTRLAAGKWGIGRELAREYGVSDQMICAIKKGRSWGK